MKWINEADLVLPVPAWWEFDCIVWKCYGVIEDRWKWWIINPLWTKVSIIFVSEFFLFENYSFGSERVHTVRCGRCKLENVKVLNKGIDWNAEDNIYWKLEVQRYEGCKIILHGNAEFEATNVVLQVCLYMIQYFSCHKLQEWHIYLLEELGVD